MKKQADFQPLNEPIPEGLEYRQEYWDSALAMIQAREKRVLFWRSTAAVLVLLVLGAGISAHYLWSPSAGDTPLATTHVVPEQSLSEQWSNRDADQPTPDYTSDEAGLNGTTDPQSGHDLLDDAATNSAEGQQQISTERGTQPLANASTASTGTDASVNGVSTAPSAATTTQDPVDALTTSTTFPVPLNATAPEDSLLEFTLEAPVHTALAHAEGGLNSPDAVEQHAEDGTTDDSQIKSAGNGTMPVLPPALMTAGDFSVAPLAFGEAHKRKLMQVPTLRPYTLSLILGNSFLSDYGADVDFAGVDPSIGLMAEFNHDHTWSVQAGLEYFSVSGIDRSFTKEDDIQSNLDDHFITLIRTNRIHYWTVPLSLGYRFGSGHQLVWTAGASILAQASQNIEYLEQIGSVTTLVESGKDKGYVDGFRAVNFYAAMGYNYALNERMSAGLRFQYGFNDITHNQEELRDVNGEFVVQGDDRNSRMLAYVRLNIW